jgi:hypothetical protein
MITTNDIERLLEEIEHLPYKPTHYDWLKNLLDEVKKQPTTATQVGIIKSPTISELLSKEEEK